MTADLLRKKELMKRNIRGIVQIGCSKPEINHDLLITETQENLERNFDECLKKKLNEFDYTIFAYGLKRLAEKAFENNMKETIRENVAILHDFAVSFRGSELSIDPTLYVIEVIRDIGIECVERKWEYPLFDILTSLLELGGEFQEKRDYRLASFSSALMIVAYCRKHMPEVLPQMEKLVNREVGNLEEIKKYLLDHKEDYSAIHFSVLMSYLKAKGLKAV